MEGIHTTELRNAVIDAATQAFHQQGIKAVTMDHIAHLLAMSKRTLYQVFEDKEALLLACLEKKHENDRLFIEKAMSESENILEVLLKLFKNAIDEAQQINPKFFTDMRKYPNVVAYHRDFNKRQAVEGVEFMKKGIEQGIFLDYVNFDIVVPFMQRKIDMLIENESFGKYKIEEIFANTIMLMLRGCTTPKGSAMIDAFFKQWGIIR